MKPHKNKKKLASTEEYQQRQFFPELFEKRFNEWVKETDQDIDFNVSGTKSYEEFREKIIKPKQKE